MKLKNVLLALVYGVSYDLTLLVSLRVVLAYVYCVLKDCFVLAILRQLIFHFLGFEIC